MFRVRSKHDNTVYIVHHIKEQDGMVMFLLFRNGDWMYWSSIEFMAVDF